MPRMILIRHGITEGNLKHQYIGSTDLPVSEQGLEAARIIAASTKLPPIEQVYCSPMLRTRQTAEIFFPDRKPILVPGLIECDFGHFEQRTTEDMENDPEYIEWCAGGGTGQIPGGDNVTLFRERCAKEFLRLSSLTKDTAAIVTHGGVIMGILERLARPKKKDFVYLVENCGMVFLDVKGEGDDAYVNVESISKPAF